jgi:hypothetical protein
MLQRSDIAAHRLRGLMQVMVRDRIAPDEKVHQLRESLAEHFHSDNYLRCETMGELVRENLDYLRRNISRPVAPPALEEELEQ